jgi:beta-lactamase class D
VAPTGPEVVERADLVRYFEAERVTGTIALFDSERGRLECSDLARCRQPFLPASTFKIPHSLIALELGVVEDSDTVLPWDGTEYDNPDWNRDHTLRTAMQVSCVPCFQHIARSIGAPRMQEWLTRFDYGNADGSGAIDVFWLNGNLRITPLEQIDFLRRMDGGKLPISSRVLDIARDIVTLDVGPDHVLRGKTGKVRPSGAEQDIGWLVGWVELGARRVFFATLIDGVGPDVELRLVRRQLTDTILRSIDVLPPREVRQSQSSGG